MHFTRLTQLRVLLFLLTIGALLVHPYVPLKRFDLLVKNKVQVDIFSDATAGGNSLVKWVNLEESSYNFSCAIGTSEGTRYCGIAIKFMDDNQQAQSIDLRKYNTLNLEASYEGDFDKMTLFYRNSDDDNYQLNSVLQDQYIYTFIDKNEFEKPITIHLENFVLAEWWLQQFYTQRNQIHLGTNNIVEIGIATPGGATSGSFHLHVRALYATGLWIPRETLYFYIVIVWLLFVAAEGAYRIVKLWQEKRRYLTRLSSLQNNLTTLETDLKELEASASLDPLTHTYNRMGLQKHIAQLATNASADPTYIYLLDIDFFKKVNDTHGHDAGDVVLHVFSQQLTANMRKSDTLARWGGEEFIILAPHSSPQGAVLFAEKLRMAIAGHTITLPNVARINITFSTGATRLINHSEFNEAFKRADKSLYAAKQQGRNRVVWADDDFSS